MRTQACSWCVENRQTKGMYKLRQGPLDWYFCDEMHAELWLEYRLQPKTYAVCRMPRAERLRFLNGRTMEDLIFECYPERCEPCKESQPDS